MQEIATKTPPFAVLDAAIGDVTIKVISVDVFDTLLLRTTKPEFQRFADMAARAAKEIRQASPYSLTTKQVFAARLSAAEIAYRTAPPQQGLREPKFDTILNLMCDILNIPQDHTKLLRRVELDYERGVLRPNRLLIDRLLQAKANGKTVIFISDMYLSGDDIHNLIKERAPDCPIDRGYSSADVGLSKRGAAIFHHISHDLQQPLSAFLHIGDNIISDVEVPKSLGMQALHTPRPQNWHTVHNFRQKLYTQHLKRKRIIG